MATVRVWMYLPALEAPKRPATAERYVRTRLEKSYPHREHDVRILSRADLDALPDPRRSQLERRGIWAVVDQSPSNPVHNSVLIGEIRKAGIRTR